MLFSRAFLVSLLVVTANAFVPLQNPAVHIGATSSTALQVAVDTSDIKNGLTVEIDGEPYKVLSFSIMKQARGAAKTTIKFKNLQRGNTIENTYRSGEKFQTAMIEKKNAQFTYNDENNFYFMDSETFEEVAVGAKIVGDNAKWIDEGMEISLVNFKDNVIEVVVPSSANYEIVETEPNVKGNTAQGYTKPATLSSGAVINVPGYLETGEMIRVDTDKGSFQERVK
ncbi:factor P [Seminavis robusta]|uniref:Factor P n=1 Tax=Seminavis robusta TaxID=568900 RepID=A0A9N8E671_9STRA|nr:factor P [Seminavis robusta]|eukprot:Sro585_g171000.1 factor P (226) ;mRNA; r:23329-24194